MQPASHAKRVPTPSATTPQRTTASGPARLPDFIIAGAMKCGTTSLHRALGRHPAIFIPDGEVQFFSADDIVQNPVLFPRIRDRWTMHSFASHRADYENWHAELFAAAARDAVLGEDAPSYLPSRSAISRIAALAPNARLIITLRDPVKRVYSHYWHLVRTYRAFFPIEDTIRLMPSVLLERSFYQEQLEHCMAEIGREKVHVVLFEEFIADPHAELRRILQFLELEDDPSVHEGGFHANQGGYPRSLSLALTRNRLLHRLYGRSYARRVPWLPAPKPLTFTERTLARLFTLICPATRRPPIQENPETVRFLSGLLRNRNAGLGRLLGVDLAETWPTFRTPEDSGTPAL